MKNVSNKLIIVFFLLSIISCNQKPALDDMAAFDRAFIPALFYAYIGDYENTKVAMYPLMHQWEKFKEKYKNVNTNSEDWNESIRLVGAWLEATNDALNSEDPLIALFQLDHARYELMDIRWRANITDYYLDYVWELEATIDVVVQTATDQMLDLLEYNQLEMMSNDMKIAWQRLLAQELDASLFSFTPETALQFEHQKKILGDRVDEYLAALKTADACEFEEAAINLEFAYWNFLLPIGDFEATQTYFAGVDQPEAM